MTNRRRAYSPRAHEVRQWRTKEEPMPIEDPTVKVLMSRELMEKWASRDIEGRRLTWEWGKPDDYGFYTPTVTTHDDDRLGFPATERVAALEAALELADALADAVLTMGRIVPLARQYQQARAVLEPAPADTLPETCPTCGWESSVYPGAGCQRPEYHGPYRDAAMFPPKEAEDG